MDNTRIKDLSGLPKGSLLYFVGIGGISMCGLAELSQSLGYKVTGSDRQSSEHTEHLKAIGISVNIGHAKALIDQTSPALVIHTAAVHDDNPELIRARELGIPVVDRAVFLGWITKSYETVINIAGTHGKTTATSMCSLILLESGEDPTIHVGAELSDLHYSTVHMGKPNRLLVSEACEYTNSYHQFESTTAVILNVERDHMDFFRDLDDVVNSFAVFTDKIRDGGTLILPQWGKHILHLVSVIMKRREAAGRSLPRIITFGSTASESREMDRYRDDIRRYPEAAAIWPHRPTVRYDNLMFIHGLPHFDISIRDRHIGHFDLQIPGQHNVENAAAAIAAAYFNGAEIEACKKVLKSFTGAEGRYTIKGTYRGALVVADYAHHPSATRVTIEAARQMPHRHIWVVYQPLTYNRVRLFFDDYVKVLLPIEHTIFYEIYSDRENDDLGMSSRLLSDAINEKGGSAEFAPTYKDIVRMLNRRIGKDDIILFLGPEQVRSFADKLVSEPDGRKFKQEHH